MPLRPALVHHTTDPLAKDRPVNRLSNVIGRAGGERTLNGSVVIQTRDHKHRRLAATW